MKPPSSPFAPSSPSSSSSSPSRLSLLKGKEGGGKEGGGKEGGGKEGGGKVVGKGQGEGDDAKRRERLMNQKSKYEEMGREEVGQKEQERLEVSKQFSFVFLSHH